jgi:hypothetical protein
MDYAGTNPGNQGLYVPPGKSGGKEGSKGNGKDGGKPKGGKPPGGKNGMADATRPTLICFEFEKGGTCSRGEACTFSHLQKDIDAFRRDKKAKLAAKAAGGAGPKGGKDPKGKGKRGKKGGMNPLVPPGGATSGEFGTWGSQAAMLSYYGGANGISQVRPPDLIHNVLPTTEKGGKRKSGRNGFKPIVSLGELTPDNFTLAPPAPPGYTAQTRVYVNGAGIVALLDTGASCQGIREEEVLLILDKARQDVAEGRLKLNSPEYPAKRLEKLTRPEELMGLAADANVKVENCIVLRVELRGCDENVKGPIREFVCKVFPKGTATFQGIILGMPCLDCAPYGLGLRLCKTTFMLESLDCLQLPRLDLHRRDALNILNRAEGVTEVQKKSARQVLEGSNMTSLLWQDRIADQINWKDTCGDSCVSSLATLQGDQEIYGQALADVTDSVLLQPGDMAEIPVTWQFGSGLIPPVVEAVSCPTCSLSTVRGIVDSGQAAQRLCVYNTQ